MRVRGWNDRVVLFAGFCTNDCHDIHFGSALSTTLEKDTSKMLTPIDRRSVSRTNELVQVLLYNLHILKLVNMRFSRF